MYIGHSCHFAIIFVKIFLKGSKYISQLRGHYRVKEKRRLSLCSLTEDSDTDLKIRGICINIQYLKNCVLYCIRKCTWDTILCT